MSDPINAGGTPQISQADRKAYAQEYKRGAALFEKALQEFENTDNMYKKAAFKDVMDKAMEVLNSAAQGLKDPNILAQSKKIADDYTTFQTKETPITEKQLRDDLKAAQKSIS